MSLLTRLRAVSTATALIIFLGFAPGLSMAQSTPQPAQASIAKAAAADSSTTVSNPYGLEALWKGGDAVAKSTLAILLLMSVGSWFYLFTKLHEQRQLIRSAKQADKVFWSAGALPNAIAALDPKSVFHHIAKAGAEASEHHQGLLGYVDLNTWITLSIQRSVDKVQSRLQGGLAFLATVGSTAPFIGLFGTVWGIYHALTAIGVAGQASIDKVAGPVGEALIMTAIGLAVAVPAVLGYNWLVRRNKAVLDEVRAFGADLHAVLLGAAAQRAGTEPAQTTPQQGQSTPRVVQGARPSIVGA